MSRVLVVGKGAPDRGGIPVFLDTLLRSELAEWHNLRFLNVAHSETPEGGQLTAGNLRRTAKDTAAVWRAARGCDVVHIHSALAPAVTALRASLMALAGRLAGARVVVHAHGGNVETWLASPWRRWLVRLAMAPADRVVAVWTVGERVLRAALGEAKVRLVDNGVRVQDFPAGDRDREVPRVLYVGLLTPRKGVLDLLEASELLTARGIDHELFLVGGTPDEGPAAEIPVRAAAANGVARLLGSRPPEQMAAAYADADIFCLPSWWEAMPLSVLEAMASGLPVVATDVGDVSRAVRHGETGYVVPPKSGRELANALEPLLRDKELRRQMGKAGRSRVEAYFSSSTTARGVATVFAELERTNK